MLLTIAAVGKLKAGAERELYDRYARRIGPAGKVAGLGPLTALEVSESRKPDAKQRMREEAGILLGKIPAAATLVALDERGEALTSEQIASLLRNERDAGAGGLMFVLGGPDGLGPKVREKAKRTISLVAITLPHGLARVVLAEQLYRAVTILSGHPYHRGGV